MGKLEHLPIRVRTPQCRNPTWQSAGHEPPHSAGNQPPGAQPVRRTILGSWLHAIEDRIEEVVGGVVRPHSDRGKHNNMGVRAGSFDEVTKEFVGCDVLSDDEIARLLGSMWIVGRV